VNLILSPEATITFSKARMLAPDGRCKTFDASADGYGRGEGCGVVVLKRLTDAVADGDTVLALIRGSAVNQDGRSSGLTVPNGPAQVEVIRQALAVGGISPSEVGYVEAHGTGTPLGDPIEVRALAAVLGEGRAAEKPVRIGSVKTNIGHLEAAAGIAGLIKVVLALRHEEIPPHLHLEQLNPYVEWSELPVVVPTERTPWPAAEGRRVAGVSSFGFSGTNAHVVVEEAPRAERAAAEVERPRHLLALSARSEAALDALLERYRERVGGDDEEAADIGFTANVGRAHFAHRLVVPYETKESLAAALSGLATGEAAGAVVGVVAPVVRGIAPARPGKLAFLFTGQGAQYAGMGRALYQSQPVFRQALERCATILKDHLPQPLLSVLYSAPERASLLDETAYTQPALFAVEYALAELWRSWGIEPGYVIGHSVGEYVAACVAGVFSLEEGLGLIAERGRLMQSLPRTGAMAAVFAERERVEAALAAQAARVSVAAMNAPGEVVISGAREAVQAVLDVLAADGIASRPLNVSHAFHSPLMDPILDVFAVAAGRIRYLAPGKALVSNLTGEILSQAPDGDYWPSHLRGTVDFAAGMNTLARQGVSLFLEIGPGSTLLALGRRCLPAHAGLWLASLRRDGDDWAQILDSLAALYTAGVDVDWAGFDRSYVRKKVTLPTYPFQRSRYWIADQSNASRPSLAPVDTAPADTTPAHPLLGRRLASPRVNEVAFQSVVAEGGTSWTEHRMEDRLVLPATAYLEMALAASGQVFAPGGHAVSAVVLHHALVLEPGGRRLLHTAFTDEGDAASFEVFSIAETEEAPRAAWTRHAAGRIDSRPSAPRVRAVSASELHARFGLPRLGAEHYERLRERGLEYGAALQGVQTLWLRAGEALARVLKAADAPHDPSHGTLPPALLDGCFQAFAALCLEDQPMDKGCLPIRLESFRLWGPLPDHVLALAVMRPGPGTAGLRVGDIFIHDEDGRVLAEAAGVQLRIVAREVVRSTLAGLVTAGDGARHMTEARRRLLEAAPHARGEKLVSFLQDEVARVLGRAAEDRPRADQGFFDMGMDSLTAVDLCKRLTAELGCALPSTVAFEYPNIDALAGYLNRQVLEEAARAAAPVPARTEDEVLTQIRELSEEHVEALLIQELERLEY